jgi:GDP-4-dehydro-6-deoxy-D-mannose reductase
MKMLITGASGFLGQHLLQLLVKNNIEIHTIDLKPCLVGIQHNVSLANISDLKNTLIAVEPDYIIHLAGIAHAVDINTYYAINTGFAANLISAVKAWGNFSCPMILTGTSAEYGLVDKDQLPITEDTPTKPYDHYGISKLAQTLMGLREARDGLPLIMIRPFNIIGPGMPSHLALQSFIQQITKIIKKETDPIIETGDLSTSRDFVDVRDVADAIWRLLSTPSAYGEVINICTGSNVKISDLLRRLIAMANVNVELQTVSHRIKNVDIPVHFGSNEKLHRLTGFTPKRELETTLRDALDDSLATSE